MMESLFTVTCTVVCNTITAFYLVFFFLVRLDYALISLVNWYYIYNCYASTR